MDDKERTTGPTGADRLSVDDQKFLFRVIEDFEEDNGPVGFAVEVLVPLTRALVQLELPEWRRADVLGMVVHGLTKIENEAKTHRAGLKLV